MIYKNYLESKYELEKIRKLMEEQKRQIETEIELYSLKKNENILDLKNYINLININSYYKKSIEMLREEERLTENKINKKIYIEKNGKESEKDWRGIIL